MAPHPGHCRAAAGIPTQARILARRRHRCLRRQGQAQLAHAGLEHRGADDGNDALGDAPEVLAVQREYMNLAEQLWAGGPALDARPMTDREIFGREEVWAYPTEVGDCEDFVLLKRKKLMEAGFSAADLLITVVRKPDGEGHAVLTLRTQSGDFVLDNLNDEVKLWTETRYTFLKRQSSTDTGRWVTIENGTSDVLVGALQ